MTTTARPTPRRRLVRRLSLNGDDLLDEAHVILGTRPSERGDIVAINVSGDWVDAQNFHFVRGMIGDDGRDPADDIAARIRRAMK